jgi:hypothetical protein
MVSASFPHGVGIRDSRAHEERHADLHNGLHAAMQQMRRRDLLPEAGNSPI